MNYMKFVSILVAFLGFTLASFSQTMQDVVESSNRARTMMSEGNLDEAIAEFKRSIELAEAVGEEAFHIQFEIESALPNLYFQKVSRVPRDNPAAILEALEATVAVAEKYNDMRTKENAERQIVQPLLALAMASYQAQNYEEALERFDNVLERNPNLAVAYYIKGVIYETTRDEANMDENYRLAIEKGREFGDARNAQQAQQRWRNFHFNAGVPAQRAQRWDDAIASFTKALEADEEHFESLLGLALANNAKRNWDEAIAFGQRALQVREESTVYWEIGRAYQGKGDTARACENLRKVTDGPRLENARHEIQHVLRCN